ncbi:MAG: hypothetical protein RLZZ618_212 [Pseudomonadota bacterium]|jgi:uncharacterized protein YijF (DUF1287 family)
MSSRREFSIALLALLGAPTAHADDFSRRLVDAARERTRRRETYDGAYRPIGYPMGDVPDHLGVCTDLVIRAYRKLGLDLQVLVHEDMRKAFHRYPARWGMKDPDRNIDHRRVPNLQAFFEHQGAARKVSDAPTAYEPGALVTWRLPGNLPHIGIVSNEHVRGTRRPRILHNIGAGPVEDDILFVYPITGHYRYAG